MKVALDTNIVLRLILEDNKDQLKKAREIIKNNNEEGDIFIASLVFLELYFVLFKVYALSKENIYLAFEKILRVKQFTFENELAIRMAISESRKKFDFSDAFIGQVGQLRNVKTYTFDKKLTGDNSFIVI